MHCRLVTNWHFSLAEITGMCQHPKLIHVCQKLALGQVSEMAQQMKCNQVQSLGSK